MMYEYVCEQCNLYTVERKPVKDRNNSPSCPKCKNDMHRTMGVPGLVFKGSGFYATDYKKPKDLRKQAIKEKKAREEGKSGYTEI